MAKVEAKSARKLSAETTIYISPIGNIYSHIGGLGSKPYQIINKQMMEGGV